MSEATNQNSMSQQMRGIVMSSLASISFGFIPLFTLPMMTMGLRTPSILAYRFLLAALVMLPILLYRKINLRISLREGLLLLSLGLIYICSAMGLQLGYLYMPTGVATVIHFTYPVYVILLLLLFFRQRPSFITLIAIVLAFVGVVAISGGGNGGKPIALEGFLIVAATGLAYASYMVIVNKSVLSTMNNIKLSFYALLFCGTGFLIIAHFWGGVQPLPNQKAWGLMILLAILPTVIANITLVEGVKMCGSTLSSVLGSLEPLTAVVIGVLIFNEPLKTANIVGIVLIISSVLLIALSGKIAYRWEVWRKRKRI